MKHVESSRVIFVVHRPNTLSPLPVNVVSEQFHLFMDQCPSRLWETIVFEMPTGPAVTEVLSTLARDYRPAF